MEYEELGPCGRPRGYGRRRPSGKPRRMEDVTPENVVSSANDDVKKALNYKLN